MAWVTYAGAVLSLLVGLARVLWSLTNTSRAERRLRGLAEIIELLPENVDQTPLTRVLEVEVARFAQNADQRARRQVSGTTVATMIVVGVFGVGLSALLGWGAEHLSDPIFRGMVYFLAVLVVLGTVVLVAVGGGTSIWKVEESDSEPGSASPL